MTQIERATAFAALHDRPAQALILTNIWDAGSASAVADTDAKAIATSSWAVAVAHGYADGEQVPFSLVETIVSRIVATVSLPVTVDFETGYAPDANGAADNLARLIDAGAIGINIEDGIPGSDGCRDREHQAQRIHALRERADRSGVPIFINARTDLFLNADAEAHGDLVADALDRARAYKLAGASGFFVPGLTRLDLLAVLCADTDMPVNAMVTDMNQSLDPYTGAGVRRISRGPAPFLAHLDALRSLERR